MNQANFSSWLTSAAMFAFVIAATPTQAQITPDATLPNNSVVVPNDNLLTIEGGTVAGGNLFHSFEVFDVPASSEAFFNNTLTIDNIITRITGGNISNINGLIRANGTANLFLINPNGIQFGSNAQLKIGGSFIGSSAESILFEDGSFFSTAVGANSPSPLLTMSVPIGLQVRRNPGAIVVRGMGHRLTGIAPIDSRNNSVGFQGSPGRTLALFGGEIHLDGGVLTAEAGHIELGGIQAGTVSWDSTALDEFDYSAVREFDNLVLSRQALAGASGAPAGSIHLQGRQIVLDAGSVVLLQNFGTQNSGEIVVNASELLELRGVGTSQFVSSILGTESFMSGNSGNVVVSAPQVRLQDGGSIATGTFGTGQAGEIVINAPSSITIEGFSPLDPTQVTNIGSLTLGVGSTGDMTISTENLRLLDSGNLSNVTLGLGNTGDLTVNVADTIEVIGTNPLVASLSAVSVASFGIGNAGQLRVNASKLIVEDGGFVNASTLAVGDAGDAIFNVSEYIEVRGVGESGQPSGLSASGLLLPPAFQQAFGLPPIPTGNSGNAIVNTPVLRAIDGGVVTAEHQGTGNAGNLQVNTHEVLLDRGGKITAATISGEGGNIILNVRDSLQLRRGSVIEAEAGGTGNSGNLSLNADTIVLLENSRINANAFEGVGGNIEISTQGLFVAPDSRITASSQFGVDGTVSVNNPIVDPASGLVALSTNPLNPNTQIQDSCEIATQSRFAIVGNGGLPPDPTQSFFGQTVWRDTRLGEIDGNLIPNSTQSTSEETSTSTATLVEATGWRRNDRGQIELIATSLNSTRSSWQPHPECDR